MYRGFFLTEINTNKKTPTNKGEKNINNKVEKEKLNKRFID